jgi:hypothetical protein
MATATRPKKAGTTRARTAKAPNTAANTGTICRVVTSGMGNSLGEENLTIAKLGAYWGKIVPFMRKGGAGKYTVTINFQPGG